MKASDSIYTLGIDVGGSNIKAVLMQHNGKPVLLGKVTEKIRKRNPSELATEVIHKLLEEEGIYYEDLAYLASTGEGELVPRKTGHFYGMTCHAKGGQILVPNAKTVVDLGALFVRAIKIDENGRVLDYKMTGQCASGSGQFIENISRYLGLSLEEVGEVSLSAEEPELPSGICAVLAETDVINMVSRGIATPNIIMGIHLSVANRIIRLLSSLKAESPVALVGGMAVNEGMIKAMQITLDGDKKQDLQLVTHPDAIYSGAIGAAFWGAFRYQKLNEKEKAIQRN